MTTDTRPRPQFHVRYPRSGWWRFRKSPFMLTVPLNNYDWRILKSGLNTNAGDPRESN